MRSDEASDARREAERVIGVVGALDPFEHRIIQSDVANEKSGRSGDLLPSLGMGSSLDDYYPSVAVSSNLIILLLLVQCAYPV